MSGKGTNVAGIYGQIALDNKGAMKTMEQTKGEFAKAYKEMQKSTGLKFDLVEHKKLMSQLGALEGRLRETRVAMNKAIHGSDEAKKLQNEIKNLTAKITNLRAVTVPANKELERLAKAEAQAAREAMKLPDVKGSHGGLAESLKEQVHSLPLIGSLGPIGAVLATVGGGAMAAAHAMHKAAESAGEYGEAMFNMATKTGMSVTQLQELKFAVEAKGLDFAAVTKGITMLEKALGSGKATDALRVLGIEARNADGSFKSMTELFPLVIEKLQSMTNATERNMLASKMFGRGWAELAPIIALNAEEFANLKAEAEELGIVMTEKDVEAAKDFQEQANILKLAWAGVMREFGSQAIPIMIDYMKALKEAFPPLITFVKRLNTAWEMMRKTQEKSLDQWHAIGKVFAWIGEQTTKAFKPLADWLAKLQPMLAKLQPWLAKLGIGIKSDSGEATKPTSHTPAKNTGPSIAAAEAADAAAELADKASSKIVDMNRALALNGDNSEAAAMKWEVLNGEYKDADAATKTLLLSTAEQVDKQNTAREAAKKHADEQKRLAEVMQNQQVKALEESAAKMREWARTAADAMKSFADETIGILKDNLRKEQEERDRAAEKARSKYETLVSIGRAGAMAMTGISMFNKPEATNRELTASDLSPGKIAAAAKQVAERRGNEAAINAQVQSSLYGDKIARAQALGQSETPDLSAANKGEQIGYLQKMVQLMGQQVTELQGLNKPRVRT